MQTDAWCAGTHLAAALSGTINAQMRPNVDGHDALLPRSSPPDSLLMALTAAQSPWPTASKWNKWRGVGIITHMEFNESVTGTFRGVGLPGAADSPLTTSSSVISFIYCALHFLLKTTVSHSLSFLWKSHEIMSVALRLASKCLYNNNAVFLWEN